MVRNVSRILFVLSLFLLANCGKNDKAKELDTRKQELGAVGCVFSSEKKNTNEIYNPYEDHYETYEIILDCSNPKGTAQQKADALKRFAEAADTRLSSMGSGNERTELETQRNLARKMASGYEADIKNKAAVAASNEQNSKVLSQIEKVEKVVALEKELGAQGISTFVFKLSDGSLVEAFLVSKASLMKQDLATIKEKIISFYDLIDNLSRPENTYGNAGLERMQTVLKTLEPELRELAKKVQTASTLEELHNVFARPALDKIELAITKEEMLLTGSVFLKNADGRLSVMEQAVSENIGYEEQKMLESTLSKMKGIFILYNILADLSVQAGVSIEVLINDARMNRAENVRIEGRKLEKTLKMDPTKSIFTPLFERKSQPINPNRFFDPNYGVTGTPQIMRELTS